MDFDPPADPPQEVLEQQARERAERKRIWHNLLHPDPRDPEHEPKEKGNDRSTS